MSQLQVTGEAKIRDIQGPVVANSGVITALNGAANQYVRGDGTLASFPTSGGGGSSVSYYLNGSVNQGTFGGSTYYQMSKNAIVGTGTNFSASANGLIAQFITDANDPDVVSIPSGNWNLEFFMNVSASSGALASFYVEFYKYNGSTFTLLATNVATPEQLTNTTTVDAYYTSVAMPLSSMAVTDRLAIRIFVNVAGKTVTLYTEDNRLCQVVTTFSKGLASLNNLTDQSQYLTTGTSGTNFAIVSSGDTHTFNLPVASATNTGKLSNTDWSTFNNKQAALSFTAPLVNTSNTISIPAATSLVDGYLDNLDWVNFNTAYNDSIVSAAVTGTTTKTLTLNQQDGGTITASWTDINTDAVTSVFGRTGAVVAQSGDYTTTQVTEGTNLYYTDARARAALSAGTGISYNNTTGVITSTITQYTDALARAALSFTAGSGAYNSTTGVITIPTNNNQITNGAGYITSSALSGYVPYTGATTNVNLGANSLTANQVIVGGAGVNNAGTFTTYDGGVATQLIGSTGNLKFFPFWNPSLGARINAENSAGSAYTPLSFFASNFYFHSNVNFNSTIGNGTYTYTLPSATGTLALLEGTQTFTGVKTFGALSNFDNVIRLKQNLALISTSSGYTTLFSTEGGGQYGFGFYNSGGALNSLNFPTASSNAYTFPAASGTVALTSNLSAYLPLTGGTLTGALSGTSATFSGNSFLATNSGDVGVGTTTPNLTAANRKVLDINGTTESLISFSSGGTNKSYIYNDGTNLITQGATLKFQTGFTDRLTIASTGAATFSSSVTIGAGTALAWGARGGITQDGSWNFSWGTNSVANAFYIQSSTGNVGIGTSSPNDLLHINGSGYIKMQIQSNIESQLRLNATYGQISNVSGDLYFTIESASGSQIFRTGSSTERMRITSAGNTQPGADNAYSLGVSGTRWSAVWAANGTIQTSDEREKKDIIDADLGLDFINKLRPVSFKWKVGQNIVTSEVVKDEEGNEKTQSVIVPREGKRTHYGLIAQEVEELLDGKDFGGFIHDEETDTKGLRYDQFIPLLIKSIQELEAKIVTLESKLN